MKLFAVVAAVAGLFSSAALAQEIPMFPGPQKEHEFLKKFVGEWKTTAEAASGPGQPAMKCTGKFEAKMLGGLWLISEVEVESMGATVNAVQTIGYDGKSQKYVGTWVDSMMNHMWKYEGTLDKTGKILTLEAEGPNFIAGGKLTKFRDIYEFKADDLIEASSQMQTEDGKWVTFMTGTSKRKK